MLENVIVDFSNITLWIAVLILSAIGLLEKWAIFYAGRRKGGDIPGLTQGRKERMEQLFERWGGFISILASIPIAGTAAAAVAGIGGVRLATFLLLAGISYLVRNWLIVILSSQIVGYLLL